MVATSSDSFMEIKGEIDQELNPHAYSCGVSWYIYMQISTHSIL